MANITIEDISKILEELDSVCSTEILLKEHERNRAQIEELDMWYERCNRELENYRKRIEGR